MWNKSGSGETKWTNNNDGTFGGSNGAIVSDGQDDIITVGKDGKVKDVQKDNRFNVFLDEKENTLDLHDAEGLDAPMLTRKFKKGDKVYHSVSYKDMFAAMQKAGSIKYNKNFNWYEKAKFNLNYARASYYKCDFGHSYFKPLLIFLKTICTNYIMILVILVLCHLFNLK